MPTPSVARHYGYLRIDNRRSGAIIFSSRATCRFLRGQVVVGHLLLNSPLIGLVERLGPHSNVAETMSRHD
jgi:hypothetical protein